MMGVEEQASARPRAVRAGSGAGQASVELISILGISLIVILVFSVMSSNYLSDIGVNRNYADAQDAVQKLAAAADSVYAQGEGASAVVTVTIPENADLAANASYIGKPANAAAGTASRQINIRVGNTDVFALARGAVTGSFPQVPGTHPMRLVSRGNYVAIGTNYAEASKRSVYQSMASGELKSQGITFTASGNETVRITIGVGWPYNSTVSMNVTPNPLNIAAGQSNSTTISFGDGDEIAITTASLPDATEEEAYSTTVAATGAGSAGGLYVSELTVNATAANGVAEIFTIPVTADVRAVKGGTLPYSWSMSGLPSGLSYSSGTGVISGTPDAGTSAGSPYAVSITVTDAVGTGSSTQLSMAVAAAASPLSITTENLPDGEEGMAYSTTLTATGGTVPYAWEVTGLPNGLEYNSETGKISGEPKEGSSAGSPYTVDITAYDLLGKSAIVHLQMAINAPASTLEITTASLPDGTCGEAYSQILAATGGTGPYTWTVTGIASGMTYDPAGTIGGTPDQSGICNICIQVDDAAAGHAFAELPLTVTAGVFACADWSCSVVVCN